MSFIINYVKDTVSDYAKTGIQAGGTLAGNAVGGVGGLVEGAGKSAAGGKSVQFQMRVLPDRVVGRRYRRRGRRRELHQRLWRHDQALHVR